MRVLTIQRKGNGLIICHGNGDSSIKIDISVEEDKLITDTVLIYTKRADAIQKLKSQKVSRPVLVPEIWHLEERYAIPVDSTWYLGEVFEIQLIANEESLIPVIFHNPTRILLAFITERPPIVKLDAFFDIVITRLGYDELFKLSEELFFDARYVLSFKEERKENYLKLEEGEKISFSRHLTDIVILRTKYLKD